MSVLSPDDCQFLLSVLNQASFKGEDAIRKWLPIFDKLHDGLEGGLATSSSVVAKEKEILDKTLEVGGV